MSITDTSNSDMSREGTRASSMVSNLTLDLSSVPPVAHTSAPSNTLIVTKLDNPEIFEAGNLEIFRDAISQYGPIHTWSPLKSFHRLIIVFYDVDTARLIKDTLEGEVILNCEVRTYYGNHTNLAPVPQHLEAPKVDKLFFISPPPSPPHDWEIRNEDPPNKTVHAEDLATALSRLHTTQPPQYEDVDMADTIPLSSRDRSQSVTLVYHPDQHGSNPCLPVISVEDTEITPPPVDADEQMEREQGKLLLTHTARPPVELMH